LRPWQVSLGKPDRGTTKRTKRAKKKPDENPRFHPMPGEDHGCAAGKKAPPMLGGAE
jgi:hypothetical protein